MPNQNKATHDHGLSHDSGHKTRGSCDHFPEFTRLKYFYGQMLSVRDFQTEQGYFLEKHKLHNRCLHGYGTVCGLEVVPESVTPDCDSNHDDERRELEAQLERLIALLNESTNEEEKSKYRASIEAIRQKLDQLPGHPHHNDGPTRVVIECGMALDCEGNELIVRYPVPVDIWQELTPDDRKRLNADGQTVYLSICYCPMPMEPVRPVLMDNCGIGSECVHSKVRDAIRVKVTIDPPEEDERCETCCSGCSDPCLLLARINDFKPGVPLTSGHIENGVRRMIGPYTYTTISGLSWTHGAQYDADDVEKFLEDGIEVRFSRPVLTETITQGVIDLWVIEGGRGRHADIYNLDGVVDLPDGRTTTWLKFRQTSRERLEEGDRVMISLRTTFILDDCCRPVDGDHIGGRVPIILPEYERFEIEREQKECERSPLKPGPWNSGNKTAGGTFESWFYIKSNEGPYQQDEENEDNRRNRKSRWDNRSRR